MNLDSSNPYQPPNANSGNIGSRKKAARRASTICIPPVLAIGSTLVLWLGFASVLGKIVVSFDNSSLMLVWSSTLFLSVAVSVYLLNQVWPGRLSPVAMSSAFVMFGVAFCLFEGDTSNGTDSFQMLILYGTLILVPAMVFVMTLRLGRKRKAQATDNVRY
jgi:hypothetical protein